MKLVTMPPLAGPLMPSEPPDEVPSTGTVRIHSDLIEMARLVCAMPPQKGAAKRKMIDYLSGLLRPLIQRDYEAARRRIKEDG